jgi:hypothetical protein
VERFSLATKAERVCAEMMLKALGQLKRNAFARNHA